MMKRIVSVLFMLCFSGVASSADPATADVAERYSYAMGVRLGQLLQAQGVNELDSRAFATAIDDVLMGRELRLSSDQMQAAIGEQQRLFAEQRARRAGANLAAGREFLARNAANADVVVLASGLQYRVIASGSGAQPATGDSVRVHYHGTLIDGRVFDSSVERGEPAEFSLGGVIPGFREAISRMHVGDRWQVFVPGELAYGERGAGTDIGPNETLIFDVELLDIVR